MTSRRESEELCVVPKAFRAYNQRMLDELSAEHRLLLLKFLCAFAWTDLEVDTTEKQFIERLTNKLRLSRADRAQVDEWLVVSPAPSTVTPDHIPLEHRRAFVEAIRALIYVDGSVDREEREHFEKLKRALS